MYGKREGCLSGLAIIHKEKGNICRTTKAWKSGVVYGVTMLQRSGMFKPDVLCLHFWGRCLAKAAKSSLPHMGRAFTDVQELKQAWAECGLWMFLTPLLPSQVAGGTHIVQQTLNAFRPSTVMTTILVDLHSYDAFPALAAMEDAGFFA